MNWYLAKIVFRIVCGNGHHTPQFDEQLRLLQALNKNAALLKAINLGAEESYSFFNNKKQLVEWKFIGVPELVVIKPWTDGAEIFSCIKEVDNAEAYTNFICDKAALLNNTLQTTNPINHF